MAETASAIIREMLDRYGLNYSVNQIRTWSGLLSDDERNMSVVEEEIRSSRQFERRFPGLKERTKNGHNAISVAEYLALEDGFMSTMRAAGMPASFYDSAEDFSNFIGNDVSVNELEQRVSRGVVAAQQAPQEVKDALTRFYGIKNPIGALTAYYLDPESALPAIEREFESAQLAGASKRTEFGELDRGQAERLQGLGVTEAAAVQGFSTLAQQEELLTQNLGTGKTFSQDEKLSAQFEGDAGTLNEIKRQREQRKSAFGGQSGGFPDARGIGGAQSTRGKSSV